MIQYFYSMGIVLLITVFFVFINFYLNNNKTSKVIVNKTEYIAPIKIDENNYNATDLPNIVENISYPPLNNKNNNNSKLSNLLLEYINKNYEFKVEYVFYEDENLLFSKIPVNFIEHGIEMKVFQFMEINNELPEMFFTLYEFNVGGLKHKNLIDLIKNNLKDNIESRVIEMKKYGDKTFIIRLESNQNKMYIVIVSGDRLLGIEYLLDEKLLRHKMINKMLADLFPLK